MARSALERCCSSTPESGIRIGRTSTLQRTWCSRGYPEPEAARGPCAESADGALRRVPHGEQAAVLRILLKTAQGRHVELQARCNGDVKGKPSDGHCTKDVAMGECHHAAAGSLTQADEP